MDRPRQVEPFVFGISDDDAKWWARGHQLAGSPFQRGRRSTVVEHGEPLQHTPGTHQSIYVLPDERVQTKSREDFAAGAQEAHAQALAVVFEGHLAEEAAPGHQETATVDCEDENTSPWPAPDGGCGADFLLCLGCGNAHVHPGHHPRLTYLLQQLRGLRSVMADHAWQQRPWHDALLRLENLRERVGARAWDAALARVSDADRILVHLLLKGDIAP